MKKIISILFVLPYILFAQEVIVQFEEKQSWKDIVNKATKKEKYIFVDCYATWCQPCKYMDEHVFTQPAVINILNDRFISWKLQFDKTDSDSQEIQSLYQEVERFKTDYRVKIFPTYLIFDSYGKLVHRIVGGSDVNVFLSKLSEGLNQESQYERLIGEFEQSKSNADFLKKLLVQAQKNQDFLIADQAVEALVNNLGKEKVLTPEFIPYIFNSARDSKSYSFDFICMNKSFFDDYLVPQKLNSDLLLSSILIYEYVIPQFSDASIQDIDFLKLQTEIENLHPNININSMMMRAKIQYYSSRQKWSDMVQSENDYLVLMGDNMNREDIKMYAQILMKGTSDSTLQEIAQKWMRSIEEEI